MNGKKRIISILIFTCLLACFGKDAAAMTPDESIQVKGHAEKLLQEFWQTKRGGWEAFSGELGKIGDPLIPLLRKKLIQEDAVPETGRRREWNQRRVAWALGELRTKKAAAALVSLLEDDTLHAMARNEAARALGRSGSAKAVGPLIRVLSNRDTDPDVRRGAAYGLGFLGREKAVPHLIEAMDDSYAGIRAGIVSALGQIGTDEAVEGLYMALDDRDGYVRKRAYAHLRRLRPENSIEILIKALQDSDWGVREDASEELIEMGDRAVVSLASFIQDGENPARWEAVRILGRIVKQETPLEFVTLLKDDDWMIRNEAEVALARIGGPSIVSSLMRLLDNQDIRARESAVWILGELRSKKAAGAITRLLQDDAIGRSAAVALGKIGSEDSVLPLSQKLKDEDLRDRRAAAWALFELASDNSVEFLVQSLQDEDGEVRFWINEALKKIGTPEALEAIRRREGEASQP